MFSTKYTKGNQPFLEFIPLEAAGICPFTTKINMAMGCDVPRRYSIAPHPFGKNQGHGVVLGLGISAVAQGIIFAIKGGFEAEMQGKIVDRTPHFWISYNPFAMKS